MQEQPPYSENPQSPGFAAPDPKNYASHEAVAKRALKVFKDGRAQARDARGNIEAHWRRQIDAYFTMRHRKNYYGRANVVDPEPFRAIEVICARLETAILGSKPILRGYPGPGEIESDRKQAELNEALLQQQLEKGSNGGDVIKSDLKFTSILGTGVLKVWWDEEFRRRRIRDPYTGKLVRKPQDVHVYRGPRMRNVELENFWVADPNCGETPDDQAFVIEEKITPVMQLRAQERAGQLVNTGKLLTEDAGIPSLEDEQATRASRATALGLNYDTQTSREGPQKTCALGMYEGVFDLYGNEEEIECWLWVANGEHVLRVCENPYWHGKKTYVSAPAIRIPGSFYGMSPIASILDLWAELNDLHNMGLDSAVLSLNPAIKVGAGAGLNMKRWVLSPGAFLPADDISQVEAFIIPPMIDVAHAAMGPMRSMIRETTSATDLLQAQQTGGIDKATIYQGAVQEANARIGMQGAEYATKLERLGDKAWSLNQQFIDTDTLVRILGKGGYEWIPVRPEDIQYPMDWSAVTVRNIGSYHSRNMGLERFLATATPLALQGQVKLDLKEILKRMWESLGMSDGDRIFQPEGPQPMDPRQEELMIGQRQAADVHPNDDHAKHAKSHSIWMQQNQQQGGDPIALQLMQTHMQEHARVMQAQQAMQQQMAALQAQQVMNQVAPPQGNGGQRPASPQAAVPGLGNQAQFGPDMGAAKELGERMGGRMG